MILQNNCRHVRLKGKGGKQHVMPCHHELEDYLIAYVEAAGLREDATSPLFRAVDNRTRSLGTQRYRTLLTSYDQAASLGVQLWLIMQHFPRIL